MYFAEQYFEEMQVRKGERHIYLATDEPKVTEQLKKEYVIVIDVQFVLQLDNNFVFMVLLTVYKYKWQITTI